MNFLKFNDTVLKTVEIIHCVCNKNNHAGKVGPFNILHVQECKNRNLQHESK